MTGFWKETLHRSEKTIVHTSLHLSAVKPSLFLEIFSFLWLLSLTIYGRKLNQKLIGGWKTVQVDTSPGLGYAVVIH